MEAPTPRSMRSNMPRLRTRPSPEPVRMPESDMGFVLVADDQKCDQIEDDGAVWSSVEVRLWPPPIVLGFSDDWARRSGIFYFFFFFLYRFDWYLYETGSSGARVNYFVKMSLMTSGGWWMWTTTEHRFTHWRTFSEYSKVLKTKILPFICWKTNQSYDSYELGHLR